MQAKVQIIRVMKEDHHHHLSIPDKDTIRNHDLGPHTEDTRVTTETEENLIEEETMNLNAVDIMMIEEGEAVVLDQKVQMPIDHTDQVTSKHTNSIKAVAGVEKVTETEVIESATTEETTTEATVVITDEEETEITTKSIIVGAATVEKEKITLQRIMAKGWLA